MPSSALVTWEFIRLTRLDEFEAAHLALGGSGPTRHTVVRQINRAYIVGLSAEFQGFARDLHSEAATYIASAAGPSLTALVGIALTNNRHLDRGNPNGGNIGSDFGRFGMAFWADIYARDKRNRRRAEALEQVMTWRNLIAHDSNPSAAELTKIAGTVPTLRWCKRWRRSLSNLIPHFDAVVAAQINRVSGIQPR
jgi:hypothetical protein